MRLRRRPKARLLFLLLLPVMVIPLRIPSRRPEDSTLAEMDVLWDAAKAAERK